MSAALKGEVDALVAKIGDKKEGIAALEDLVKLAGANGNATQAFLVRPLIRFSTSGGQG